MTNPTKHKQGESAASRWSDLPFDLLRDVSFRLHTSTDFVRFHAVCKPWRHTLPPASRRPAFMPWLLSPRDSSDQRTARCFFSSGFNRRRRSRVPEIIVRDRGWVISSDDDTAASVLTSIPDNSTSGVHVVDNPLAGSAAIIPVLPSAPRDWQHEMEESFLERATGIVYSDGTTFLHDFFSTNWRSYSHMAILHPGGIWWTFRDKHGDGWCFSYYKGNIVRCSGQYWHMTARNSGLLNGEPGKRVQSSYLFQSRGELLWAWVQLTYSSNCKGHSDFEYLDDLAIASSVSIYALEDADSSGGQPQWVKRDGQSFADRVIFLGKPNSFAVEAAPLGIMNGDGCAYFVHRGRVFEGVWSEPYVARCGVFRYSFVTNKSELVETLPAQWADEACMWLTPQPVISCHKG